MNQPLALRTIETLPGPRGLPLIGSALQMSPHQLHLQLEQWAQQYGRFYRVQAAGMKFRVTDHGYCRSLYVLTPDELKLEYTLDPDNADEIAGKRRADAHAELERWLAGDRTPNNTDHKSVFK